MLPKRFVACLGILMVSGMLFCGCGGTPDKAVVAAGKYPVKPITIIVPVEAGGVMERTAQALDKPARKYLSRDFAVARVPGSEADGWDELAGAKPDGYTIGIASQGILMQSLQKNGKYNYFTSLDPLAGVAVIPVALVINGGRSVTDLAGLVAEAGGQVRTLRVGYPLPGSIFHVVSAAFLRDGALTAECVSLKNTAAVISALEDGSLDAGFVSITAVQERLRDGKLKVLAVTGDKRLPAEELRSIPTFRELGMDIPFDSWLAIAAPKGLPADVKARLVNGIREMVNDAAFGDEMRQLGFTVEYMGPGEVLSKWISEGEKLAGLIQDSGFTWR